MRDPNNCRYRMLLSRFGRANYNVSACFIVSLIFLLESQLVANIIQALRLVEWSWLVEWSVAAGASAAVSIAVAVRVSAVVPIAVPVVVLIAVAAVVSVGSLVGTPAVSLHASPALVGAFGT